MHMLTPGVLRALTPSCPPASHRLTTFVVLIGAALLLISRGTDVADTLVCLGTLCGLAAAMTTNNASAAGEAWLAAVDVLLALQGAGPACTTEAQQ
jgi:hypothetical protein